MTVKKMDPACWLSTFETKCQGKFLCISCFGHKTNDWVRARSASMWVLRNLFWQLSRQKCAWFGHVTRNDSLSKTILQCTSEGGQQRGQQRKCWMDGTKVWSSLPMPELLTMAFCRKKKKKENNVCWISCHVPPTTQSVKWLYWIELTPGCALMVICISLFYFLFFFISNLDGGGG